VPTREQWEIAVGLLASASFDRLMPITFELMRAWYETGAMGPEPHLIGSAARSYADRGNYDADWGTKLYLNLCYRMASSEQVRQGLISHSEHYGPAWSTILVHTILSLGGCELRDDEVAALCRSVSLWPRLNTWYDMPRRCPPGTRVALLGEVVELQSISRAEQVGEEDEPPLQFPHLQLAWTPSNSEVTAELAARSRMVMSRTDRTPKEIEALAMELVRQQSEHLLPWAYRMLEREPRLSPGAKQALREYVFSSFGHSPRHRARLIRHVSAYGNKHYRFMFDQWKAAGLPFNSEEVDRLYRSYDHWVKTLTIRNWRSQCRQDAVQHWEKRLERERASLEILR
jgi:hypothetical protein